MYLIKKINGSYIPYDEYDGVESQKIKVGTVIKFNKARNYKFHKKAFHLLNIGFENQEKYKTFEMYRKIMTILAGYFEYATGKDGIKYPIPDSISYDKMSAEKFDQYFEAMSKVVADDLKVEVSELDIL